MAPSLFSFSLIILAHAAVAKNVTNFPESLFGTWRRRPAVAAKSILGPVASTFLPSMSILRDPDTDDVWFTLLAGQMWHVIGNETQYCFGPAEKRQLSEQSPFSVWSMTSKSVEFCWRRGLRGMPTQAKGCMGCDCARILLNLTDQDDLHFQFWMSPPVIHADVTFARFGPPGSFKAVIESTMDKPYDQCTLHDHYGPNVPNEPILTTVPPSEAAPKSPSGCEQAISEAATKTLSEHMNLAKMKDDDVSGAEQRSCYRLNGVNWMLDTAAGIDPSLKVGVPDVKILFTTPPKPCAPCDVTYTVSAAIADDEFIGVGFKGRSWERDFPYAPEAPLRPCYFGMCIDPFDNFTSDRIALGYTADGGCVREMVAKNIIGAPTDVDYKILKSTSVQRQSGRTVLQFTISQHWQWDKDNAFDGPWRVMWAIGKVIPAAGKDACAATVGYHDNRRGVAPLRWLSKLGSTPCSGEDSNEDATLIV